MSKSQLAFRLLRSGLGRRSPRVAVASDRLSGHQLVNAVRRVSTHGLPIDSEHTAKWMTNFEKKSPMELIAEIPPVEVHARVVACEGGRDPALGHPIEYISLDLEAPAICKYCGLRYVQAHGHHGGH
ncbi:NADH dehydrogenase (ubiquinone) Fe-S protein 6 [Marchantia polymorpha subsp. ruderalis]